MLYQGIEKNGDERTYSSLVESLSYNWEEIKKSRVVGTLLLTDAVPAYETYGPQQAADAIDSLLGGIPFVSASIVADVYTGMIVQPERVFDTASEKWVTTCGPDHEGPRNVGFPIVPESWDSPDPEALNQFIEAVYGRRWDICEPDYDVQLKNFIDMVLALGGCLPIS